MNFRRRNLISGLLIAVAFMMCSLPILAEDQSQVAIGPGRIVSLNYTVSLPDAKWYTAM